MAGVSITDAHSSTAEHAIFFNFGYNEGYEIGFNLDVVRFVDDIGAGVVYYIPESEFDIEEWSFCKTGGDREFIEMEYEELAKKAKSIFIRYAEILVDEKIKGNR